MGIRNSTDEGRLTSLESFLRIYSKEKLNSMTVGVVFMEILKTLTKRKRTHQGLYLDIIN